MAITDYPEKVRPFAYLGFIQAGSSGKELYGNCPICGGYNKFYVNQETGQWSCKAGACGLEGNIFTFLKSYYESARQNDNLADWNKLSELREIEADFLKDAGLAWDGRRWLIPFFNKNGTMVQISFYTPQPGQKIRRMPHPLVAQLHGLNDLFSFPEIVRPRVYLVEGEWDKIALDTLFKKAGHVAAVVGVPGANTFKESWVSHFEDCEVAVCYDNDEGGAKGTTKAIRMLRPAVKRLWKIKWPETLPLTFDIRDFYRVGGDVALLDQLLEEVSLDGPVTSPEKSASASTSGHNMDHLSGDEISQAAKDAIAALPPLSASSRPAFGFVLQSYQKWLKMTPEMADALRVIFAVVISNQIPGDPLWLHIVGPPGCGKTELLMSCAESTHTIARSTLTPHSLVSGYRDQNVKDPSLLPHLFGKTFILKDLTEVYAMPAAARDDIFGTLRGAYDGVVEKAFGGPVGTRRYVGHFNMLSGVTPVIFGERSTTLGERFLIFHVYKGVGGKQDDIISAALANAQEALEMKRDLIEAANSFLEYRVDVAPQVQPDFLKRIVSLAQIVSILRGTVDRDGFKDKMRYRPQHEVGTRVAKQIKKLMIGLALTNSPVGATEEDYQVASAIAMDSCIGFNLEIIKFLFRAPGSTTDEICAELGLSRTTLQDNIEDLYHLGALGTERRPNKTGIGRAVAAYHLSENMVSLWQGAKLDINMRNSVRIRRKDA